VGKVGGEEGRRCPRCQSRDSPAAAEEITVEQVFPCCPRRDHSGAGVHTAAHRGPHTREGGYLLKDCSLWRGPTLEQGKL